MWHRLSLTARLSLAYATISSALLLGLGLLLSQGIDRHFAEMDRHSLHAKAAQLAQLFRQSPRENWSQKLPLLLENHGGLSARLWLNGRLLYQSRTQAGINWQTLLQDDSGQYAGHDYQSWQQDIASPAGTIRLQLVQDDGEHRHFRLAIQQQLLLYTLLAMLLGALAAWWIARRGMAPLHMMKQRAQEVSATQLAPRMPVASVPIEMADLAASLNAMLDRLQADFIRLNDFSSDLAHELRTPISNLLMQTQVTLSQSRTAADYREVLASNAEELQRLSRMVADMLLLARAENGLALPQRESVQLEDEVATLLAFYEMLAEDKQVSLHQQGRAVVMGDRLMLHRALANLLSNAVRHANHGSRVHVHIQHGDTGICLEVHNEGETIPAHELPRLFDRFYRSDKARRHPAAEGAGLGLAITRAIARAHGGEVSASSEHGHSCFTLRLPAADAAQPPQVLPQTP